MTPPPAKKTKEAGMNMYHNTGLGLFVFFVFFPFPISYLRRCMVCCRTW